MPAERLGIGILCFERPERAEAAVASIRANAERAHDILLFDNTENGKVGEWARSHAADVAYVRSPYNVGCSVARIRLAEYFLNRGIEHFIVQDDDIEWARGDAAVAMRDVFARHEKTGIASWFLATRQMSGQSAAYQPDETGVILETPGACAMYSRAGIEGVLAQAEKDGCPHCRPWTTRVLCYRFDSLYCLLARKAGYATRVVWPDLDLIRHNHPHGGVKLIPRLSQERAHSQRVFKEECRLHGLTVPGAVLC